MSFMAVSIHVKWGRPMGLGWHGMECAKKQLLDHDIIRLAGCVPQPPDMLVYRYTNTDMLTPVSLAFDILARHMNE